MAAQVSRKASGEQILKLIDRCKSLYYRSEGILCKTLLSDVSLIGEKIREAVRSQEKLSSL